MAALSAEKVAKIVAALARGADVRHVADGYRVSPSVVEQVRDRYGPDLVALEVAAERLRERSVEGEAEDAPARAKASPGLFAEAARYPALKARLARAEKAVEDLREGLAVERRTEAEFHAVEDAKKAYEDALARYRAAKGLPASKQKPKAAADRDYDPAAVRQWARDNGIAVTRNSGRTPKAWIDGWRASQATNPTTTQES